MDSCENTEALCRLGRRRSWWAVLMVPSLLVIQQRLNSTQDVRLSDHKRIGLFNLQNRWKVRLGFNSKPCRKWIGEIICIVERNDWRVGKVALFFKVSVLGAGIPVLRQQMSELYLSAMQWNGWYDGTFAEDNGMLMVHQVKYFYEVENCIRHYLKEYVQLRSRCLGAGGDRSCSSHLPGQPYKFSLAKYRF